MTKKYSQLNQEQRYQIVALFKLKFSIRSIAKEIGVAPSTVSREIRRNCSTAGRYNATNAQTYASDRRKDRPYFCRFTNEMQSFIRDKLTQQQWSPEQITGYCRAEKIPMVSHERIYQFIYGDMKKGGTLFKQLRTQHKKRKNRTHKKDKRGLIPNRISIHQRPDIVQQKQRYGDWEVDLIESANHKSFALTLVERKSQFALIVKTPDKHATTIQSKIINALAAYKELVHSITSDNGKEFAGHQYIAKKLQTEFFFADPYSSWQRGLSEYTNKLYRQYLPKKSNFNNYDIQYFVEIQTKLNNRPRKSLGFKTPLQIFIRNFKT